MAIKSQLRLAQLTGSAVSLVPGGIVKGPLAAAQVGDQDLGGVLKYIAQSISNINGLTEYGAQAPGTFTFPTMSVTGSALQFNQAAEIEAAVGALTLDGATGINLQEAGTTVLSIDTNRDVDIANARNADFDFSGAISIDAAAASNFSTSAGGIQITSAGDAALFRVTSDAAGEDLVLQQAGANDSGVLVTAAGTGADAIKLAASAGGIDVDVALGFDLDAAGAVALDSSAASITVGSILADGQTVKIGKAGAAELSLEPHGTPANEKISLINTAGTGADALVVNAVAGGIELNAGTLIEIDAATGLSLDSADGDVTITADGADNAVVIKGDHTGGTAIHLDANENAASVIDVDFGIFDADGVTFNVDTTGAISLDASGVSSNFTLATGGADAKDLTIASTGGGNSSVIVNSAGTGPDAISLQASAGGIQANVVDGQTVALGLGGGVELMLSPSNTPASEKALLENSSGDGRDAIQFRSLAGYVGITGSLGVEISGSNFGINTADSGVAMSGGQMIWASAGEFNTFVGKPLFSSTTTLVGALNALATAAGGGTIGKAIITGSAVTKLQLTGAGMVDGGGFTRIIDLREANPANTEVFVNGQLLVSGTGTAGSGGDYGVDRTDPAAVNFQFSLQADDVVVVKTTSEQ